MMEELSHSNIVKVETELENGKRKREEFGGGGDSAIATAASSKIIKGVENPTLDSSIFPLGGSHKSNDEETIIIEIVPEKVGHVIGTKGARVQDILARTGAKVYVNQDFPAGVNRQVNITGTHSQAKAGAELVRLIIEQGPMAIHVNSPFLTGGSTFTEVLQCSQGQVGKIIGKGGAGIRDLFAKTGAKVQIDQDFPVDVPRKINITGTSTAVCLARTLIENLLNESTSFTMEPESLKQTIEVPKAYVGKIIGKGGETVNLMHRKSGAKVIVDQAVPEGMPCKVIMTGTAQSLLLASQLVGEIMMGVPASRIGAGLPDLIYQPGPMSAYSDYSQSNLLPYSSTAYGMPEQYPAAQQASAPYGGYTNSTSYQQQHMHGQDQGQYHQYDAAAAIAARASGYQSYGASNAYTSAKQTNQRLGMAPSSAKASVWTEHRSEDGIPFWFNCSTGVSQWERPKNF